MFVCFVGVLLLDESVHELRADRREREIRDNRHWRDNGGNDVGVDTTDGQNGKEDATPLWPRRDVYILNIHHHFVSDKSKW